MKRRWRKLISLICLVALLAGCGMADELFSALHGDGREGFGTRAEETPEALFPEDAPETLWGRQQLDAGAREAYDRLSAAVAARQEEPVQVETDEDSIRLALTALRIDHPEYFWFDGEMSYVTTTYPGYSVTECTMHYTMSESRVRQAHRQVEDFTAGCLASLEGAGTDYDKILGVYRYIIQQTDYVLSESDQSILSVMDGRRATCAGYAKSFQYMMDRLGIPCVLALGEDASGESHGWNIVKCGGQWYQIDVTWGDPVDPDGSPGSSLLYTYCMITDQEIYRDHVLVCDLPMPRCSATEYNYFTMTGRRFDSWDEDAYRDALASARAAGEQWFSVRFSGRSAYETAREALFEQGVIWDALDQGGDPRVVYSLNDLFYDISVQLG